jgi:predicted transposase/invertase (TIGR01784 family)
MKPKPVFADPKTDVIFKKIFGQKAHKNLLLELLNSLLELDEAHRIVDIDYLTPEQLPPRHDLKLSILDVKCTDARGTHYVVEMQVIEVEGFQKRVVYNACKAYSTQLGVGDDYPQLNDVIAVTLCDFVLWPQRSEKSDQWKVPMLSRWRMQEQHSGERSLGEVQYVFLELPKYQAGKRPRTTVDKWTHFFRVAPSLERIPEELSEGPYAQALEVARRANFTEEEWQEYERAKMAEQDFRGGLSLAEKRGLEQGLKQGEQRGLKRGLSQGRKEGRKEGREEGREEGRKEGELRGQVTTLAEAVLTVLTARGLSISESVRAQILSTTDPALLTAWLARASTAASAEDCLTQPSV